MHSVNYIKISYILLIIINILLLVYLLFGFCKVNLEINGDSVVYLNENRLDNKTSLLLRPGTYSLRMVGNKYDTRPIIIKALPFTIKSITPAQIDPVSILLGSTAPPIINTEYITTENKYFNDNKWLVAKYYTKSGNKTFVCAFMYVFEQWQTRACYPKNTAPMATDSADNILPNDVLAIYKQMVASYAED